MADLLRAHPRSRLLLAATLWLWSAAACATDGPLPPGFSPVRVEGGADAPLVVSVWGRQYHFEAGPMPSQIHSQDLALFSSPPTLQVGPGTAPVQWISRGPVESSSRQASFTSLGRAGPYTVSARTQVEFDGMILIHLEVHSSGSSAIGPIQYEFVFPEANARNYNHHLDYNYNTMRVKNRDLLETAGRVSAKPLRLPFVPSFALGNRNIGFEWWSDTDLGWTRGDKAALELRKQADRVSFTVRPVSKALRNGTGVAWQHEFALFALPTRSPPAAVHGHRFIAHGEAPRYKTYSGRLFSIPFPGLFGARWHGLPEALPTAEHAALRRKFRKLGVGYIPYGALTAAPSLHPMIFEQLKEWPATGKLFTWPASGMGKFLQSRGWKPKTPYSYAVCVAKPGYLDWMLEQVLETLEKESLDGLYFDWGAAMEPCIIDPKTRAVDWGYLALRDFYRRLYEAVKARDPERLITIHTHGQPRALGNFVDYVFIGEALTGVFRGKATWNEMAKNRRLYKAHYMNLPDGFLEALIFPRSGGTTSLLPEVQMARDPAEPTREARLTRELFASVLVEGIPIWATNCHPETRVSLLQAIDRFGNLDEARLMGWWEDPLGVGARAGSRTSVYLGSQRALVVSTNWSEQPIPLDLGPGLRKLGVPASALVQNAENARRSRRLGTSGKLPVSVPSRDLVLTLVSW